MATQSKVNAVAKDFPKAAAFEASKVLVDPIIEQHGLEDTKSGAFLQPVYTTTKVDQHVDHILRVANWLLGEQQ